MKLCFDATRFGGGLSEGIELASERGVPAIEYTFAPFKTSPKANQIQKKEGALIEKLASRCAKANVEIATLSLNYVHVPGEAKSFKKFTGMISKLSQVCGILGCKRLAFFITPGPNVSDDYFARLTENGSVSAVDDMASTSASSAWKEKFEKEYEDLSAIFTRHSLKPLLRLGTPAGLRGVSLKNWRATEPQDWRDLLSACPDLALSFSPGDCLWLGIDYLRILPSLVSAIEHIEAHDVEINRDLLKDSGLFGPLWWRYRQIGKGQVDWQQFIEALKLYDYQGDFSIHLDDEFIDADEMTLLATLEDGIQKIRPLLN